MADDTKQRINLHLSPALLAALDEWRRAEIWSVRFRCASGCGGWPQQIPSEETMRTRRRQDGDGAGVRLNMS
jgi:hypothetical protein